MNIMSCGPSRPPTATDKYIDAGRRSGAHESQPVCDGQSVLRGRLIFLIEPMFFFFGLDTAARAPIYLRAWIAWRLYLALGIWPVVVFWGTAAALFVWAMRQQVRELTQHADSK